MPWPLVSRSYFCQVRGEVAVSTPYAAQNIPLSLSLQASIHALLHHQPPGLACTGQQQQYHPVILTCRDARLPKQVLLRVERARVVGAVGRAALAPRRRHVALNVTRCDHPHSSDSVAKSSVLGFQFYSAGRVPGPVPPPYCTRYCEFRSFPLPNSISLNFLAFSGILQKNSM